MSDYESNRSATTTTSARSAPARPKPKRADGVPAEIAKRIDDDARAAAHGPPKPARVVGRMVGKDKTMLLLGRGINQGVQVGMTGTLTGSRMKVVVTSVSENTCRADTSASQDEIVQHDLKQVEFDPQ